MNRFLEKLLDGAKVEWVELGTLARIKHGKDWKKLNPGNIPVYGSGGIMGYVDKCSYDQPTVLVPRKGSISNIFYVDKPFWNVDTIYYLEINADVIIPKYLYYFLTTIDFLALDTGSVRPSLTKEIINRIVIPIPCPDDPANSKRIQTKIVQILDKFAQLTAQLTAEYNIRKRQYQYYRDELLKFNKGKVEWKTICEVADIIHGKDWKNLESGKIPVYGSGGIMGYVNQYAYNKPCKTWPA